MGRKASLIVGIDTVIPPLGLKRFQLLLRPLIQVHTLHLADVNTEVPMDSCTVGADEGTEVP